MSPEQARIVLVVSAGVGLAAIALAELARSLGRAQMLAYANGFHSGLAFAPDVSPAPGAKPAATSAPSA